MRAHPLDEVRACAAQMLSELRKVIPAFLTRVDQPDRGGRWSEYLAGTRKDVDSHASTAGRRARPRRATRSPSPTSIPMARSRSWPPRSTPPRICLTISCSRSRAAVKPKSAPTCFAPMSASGANRRHKPGRAFERTAYRFDVLTDYGAFRDLQRHRLLTLEWQPLTPRHGYVEPDAIAEAGARGRLAAASWTRPPIFTMPSSRPA